MLAVWIGASLIIIGVVWSALVTLQRGRLSDPHPPDHGRRPPTLEPRGRGKQLGLMNPAFGLILAGVVILLLGPLL